MSDTNRESIFVGIPASLRPAASVERAAFELVHDGPRNLAARPFDYRNPFPLQSPEEIEERLGYGANIPPWVWPVGDRGADLNYYANDQAAIGLPGGPECALVDRFGTLRCYTGAWAFGLGSTGAPPDLRARHLLDGHWPVVMAETNDERCSYQFEYFASEIAGLPDVDYPVVGNGSYQWIGGIQPRGRNIVLWVRCTVSTGQEAPIEAGLWLAYRQSSALCAGAFYANPRYAPPWEQIRLQCADGGPIRLLATHEGVDYTLGLLQANDVDLVEGRGSLDHWPPPLSKSPKRPARHTFRIIKRLESGVSLVASWLIPLFPLPREHDGPLPGQRYPPSRRRALRLWQKRRSKGLQIEIPEKKVSDAFLQALNHLDLCTVALDRSLYPTPGPSGGHHIFYDRDNVDLIYAYDLIGQKEPAERMIDQYGLRSAGQESSGMVLWLLGKHLALTQDRKWAKRMLPEAMRRMSWLVCTWSASRHENDGLLPLTQIGDNELAIGHFVSYHLYALAGARAGVALARSAGEKELAAQWDEFHQALRAAVLTRMERLIAETGGILTPTFEGFDAQPVTVHVTWVEEPYSYTPSGAYGETGGVDWHNLGAVFPTEVLPPNHPWIDSSLARWRHAYVEGVFPYPNRGDYTQLHNYNTINLSETWLRRGDYAETLRDLYGLLLHTSATHASGEVVGSAARYDYGCTPHGWFSAKLVRFVRDLLAYEGHDGRLHLLGCLSPAWMSPGLAVGMRDAPTELGPISFRATMRANGLDMDVDFQARPQAKGMIVHVPPFVRVTRVEADGQPFGERQPLSPHNGARPLLHDGQGEQTCWHLPSATRQVRISWVEGALPRLSFQDVVQAYLAEYRQRVERME